MQVRCFKFCENCIEDISEGVIEFNLPVSISETTIEDCDNHENTIEDAHNSPERLMELDWKEREMKLWSSHKRGKEVIQRTKQMALIKQKAQTLIKLDHLLN